MTYTAVSYYKGGADRFEFEADDYSKAKEKALEIFKIYVFEEDKMSKERIMCCCLGCTKEAEYIVIYGNAPNDATESCVQHVGELGDNDTGRFEVVRLNKEGGACEAKTS